MVLFKKNKEIEKLKEKIKALEEKIHLLFLVSNVTKETLTDLSKSVIVNKNNINELFKRSR